MLLESFLSAVKIIGNWKTIISNFLYHGADLTILILTIIFENTMHIIGELWHRPGLLRRAEALPSRNAVQERSQGLGME